MKVTPISSVDTSAMVRVAVPDPTLGRHEVVFTKGGAEVLRTTMDADDCMEFLQNNPHANKRYEQVRMHPEEYARYEASMQKRWVVGERLSPHRLIENLDFVTSNVVGHAFDPALLDSAHKLCRRAVHFDFGEVRPLDQHYEFANEMWDKGLFRLPAEVVMFTWRGERENALVASMGSDREDSLVWFVVGRAACGNEMLPNIPFVFASTTETDVHWRLLSRVTNAARDARTTEIDDKLRQSFCIMSAFTVMLMSKDVDQQIFPASAKLNKARAAKGKPAINERRVIRIKAEHRRAYAHAASEHAAGRSPVMHFRRGHFRKIHKGEETERVVPVAPCVVNAAPDAKPILKQYEVVK